ncbi:MAG: AlpA family phage regulatory protein [bacterium]
MFQRSDSDFFRLPRVCSATGVSRSTTYLRIAQGLFPTPIPLGGGRIVGWPAREVAAVNEARIAGWSDAKIRELVTDLIAGRTGEAR